MRVFCENCSQQYIIDEETLSSSLSRFKCKKCSSYVFVSKPAPVEEETEFEDSDYDFGSLDVDEIYEGSDNNGYREKQADGETVGSNAIGTENWVDYSGSMNTDPSSSFNQDMTISSYMSITFLLGFVFMSAIIILLYWRYVPALVNEQIGLRTSAISQSFSESIKMPLTLHDYLQVNREVRRISRLPGVAYAAVLGKNHDVITGMINNKTDFYLDFQEEIEESVFPKQLARKNNLIENEQEKSHEFIIGGQSIYDVAVSLGHVGGEVHVGIFTADIQKSIKESLVPMLISIFVLFVLGMISFWMLARFITKPVQDLTNMADRISQGGIDQKIIAKGPREIRNLCRSLERMRTSIKGTMTRLQK